MKKTLFITLLFFLVGLSSHLKAQTLTVYQYWNSTLHRHFYTTDFSELGTGKDGWGQETVIGHLMDSGSPSPNGTAWGTPIYRFYNTSTAAHYYTMNPNVYPSGFHLESIMGWTPAPGLTPLPVYEFYNSGDYYYSTSQTTPSGYTLNGIAYYISY